MDIPIDLGSRRELFADSLLIDRLKKSSLQLHEPQAREVVLRHDTPWEGPFSLYHTIIHDGDRYLLYYRGWRVPGEGAVYCVAVSDDGIHFDRPQTGLHTWPDSQHNNIILAQEPFTHTVAPFLDTRSGVPNEQRYKALSRHLTEPDSHGKRSATLHGMISADGINWDIGAEPIITDGLFDSQNVGFWSEAEDQYVAYYRTFSSHEGIQEDHLGPTTTATSLRRIKRCHQQGLRPLGAGHHHGLPSGRQAGSSRGVLHQPDQTLLPRPAPVRGTPGPLHGPACGEHGG